MPTDANFTARADWIRFHRARGRCECRRCPECAEPDLDKRCRARHGEAHPASEQIIEVAGVHLGTDWRTDGPNLWRALCQNCQRALATMLARDTAAHMPNNTYSLFPEDLR